MKVNRRKFFKTGVAAPVVAQAATIIPSVIATGEMISLAAPLSLSGIGEIHVIDLANQIIRFTNPNGLTQWLKDGKRHREDGPAVLKDDHEGWWLNGVKHRADGPAIKEGSVCEEWWVNGQLHRADGPASIDSSGTKNWWLNGVRHRIDGPAIETIRGHKHWYLNGKRHRENGPAVEHPDGSKEWYQHGKCHRIGGPAIEVTDSSKFWYMNGQMHREDGPAVEYSGGHKEWYLNGKEIPESVFPFAKPKLLTLAPNVALTSLRAQRLALGLTFRTFCKLNNLNPIEQRQLERAEETQPQLVAQEESHDHAS